ncbi:MAG: cell division protein FtsQ/DivIB [Azoarcus sp.]|jgi:cell division protein FtsQ|nr:cell division protein FtsQ/DivIB [Azoarcus sp.]
MALAKEPPARAQRRTGLWHRPELLDLISDALLLFAAAALGWALVTWALAKPLFPLRRLELSAPPAQVTQAQLEFVARTAIHGNFFTARLEDVRAAFEKLPWVRHAGVRRLWPDALELSLEEHEAVAYWRDMGGDGNVRLVNRQGEVFAASSDARMPEFSGPPGMAAAVLERHVAYSRILQPLGAQPARLELSARGAWQLWLNDGLFIALGRGQENSPLDERLERFVAAWPRLRDSLDTRIARADLRYPNGFALTPVGANINTSPRPAAASNAK